MKWLLPCNPHNPWEQGEITRFGSELQMTLLMLDWQLKESPNDRLGEGKVSWDRNRAQLFMGDPREKESTFEKVKGATLPS